MMRTMAATIIDNAMLYKDITQWLRYKTFSVLFFGLLLVSEIIAVMFISLPMDQTHRGPLTFSLLSTGLFLYMLVIAFMGYSLTNREFINKTFELYELSGMSLEKMIFGKLLSMITQFLFGFFCIVPFLFFAFVLGGLDFYLILSVAVIVSLLITPLYLLALLMALLSRFKAISTLGKLFLLLCGFYIFLFSIRMILAVTFAGGRTFLFSGSTTFLKQLFVLNGESLTIAAIFLVFYIQICLLLFYICCNAISPKVDSRSTSIMLLFTSLSLSYLLLLCGMIFKFGEAREAYYFMNIPVFIFLCIGGFFFYYTSLERPIMAQIRHSRLRKRSVLRFCYYWFEPTAWGGLRTVLLLCTLVLLSVGMVYVLYPFAKGKPLSGNYLPHLYSAISLPLQVPFFLAFPACFLLGLKRFRYTYASLRVPVLMCWTLLGVPVMILTIVVFMNRMDPDPTFFFISNQTLLPIMRIMSLLVSPISSIMLLGYADMENGAALIRIFSGFVGLIVMYYNLSRYTNLLVAENYIQYSSTRKPPSEADLTPGAASTDILQTVESE
jgi:hypothetical protein